MPLFMTSAAPKVLFTSSAAKTVGGTTTPTSMIPTGVGSLVLPPNFWVPGKMLRIAVTGFYSTAAVLPGTLQVQFMLGATAVGSGTAGSLVVSLANAELDVEAMIHCRTAGAAGTVVVAGDINYGAAASTASLDAPIMNPAGAGSALSTTAVDTTVSATLDCLATWSNGSASNTLTVTNCSVEALN